MQEQPQNQSTGLPLALRLRRAVLIALLLGLWAPFKIMWEQDLTRQQNDLRYHGAPVTLALRDKLSQGMMIAVLGGMRSIVADFLFVQGITDAWETEEYFKMAPLVDACTTLQPRAIIFWDMGGWELAWNASVTTWENKAAIPDDLRRLKATRYWIDRGLDVYLRGIENNPNSWKLNQDAAWLYQQRLKDYKNAAKYYKKASQLPGAPVFLERFGPIMLHLGGDDAASYAEWKELWERLTPEQRADKQHWAGVNNARDIRQMEDKFSIPKEKRIFPN